MIIKLSSTFVILLLSITTKPLYSSNELTSESTYARRFSGRNDTSIGGSNIFDDNLFIQNGPQNNVAKGKKTSKLKPLSSRSKKGQTKRSKGFIYPSSMPSKKKTLRMEVSSNFILFSADFDRCPDADEIGAFEKEKFEFQQEHYDDEHVEANFNMMGLSATCDENDQGGRRQLQGGNRRQLRTRSSSTFKPPPKRTSINTAESKLAASNTANAVTGNAINQDRRRLQAAPGTKERLLEKFSQSGNPYLVSIYDLDVANITVTFRRDDDGEIDEDYDYYANN